MANPSGRQFTSSTISLVWLPFLESKMKCEDGCSTKAIHLLSDNKIVPEKKNYLISRKSLPSLNTFLSLILASRLKERNLKFKGRFNLLRNNIRYSWIFFIKLLHVTICLILEAISKGRHHKKKLHSFCFSLRNRSHLSCLLVAFVLRVLLVLPN